MFVSDSEISMQENVYSEPVWNKLRKIDNTFPWYLGSMLVYFCHRGSGEPRLHDGDGWLATGCFHRRTEVGVKFHVDNHVWMTKWGQATSKCSPRVSEGCIDSRLQLCSNHEIDGTTWNEPALSDTCPVSQGAIPKSCQKIPSFAQFASRIAIWCYMYSRNRSNRDLSKSPNCNSMTQWTGWSNTELRHLLGIATQPKSSLQYSAMAVPFTAHTSFGRSSSSFEKWKANSHTCWKCELTDTVWFILLDHVRLGSVCRQGNVEIRRDHKEIIDDHTRIQPFENWTLSFALRK